MASDHAELRLERTPTANYNPDGTTKVFLMAVRLAGGEVTTVQDEHGRKRPFHEGWAGTAGPR